MFVPEWPEETEPKTWNRLNAFVMGPHTDPLGPSQSLGRDGKHLVCRAIVADEKLLVSFLVAGSIAK